MKNRKSLEKELGLDSKKCNNPYPEIDTDAVYDRVKAFLRENTPERKISHMKITRKAAIIAAATLLLCIGAFAAAATFITNWESHSSGIPEYTSLPSAEEVKKDIGYDVAIIDVFSNGYSFDEGSLVNNTVTNNSGGKQEFKSVTFRYTKGDNRVIFSQDKLTEGTILTEKIIAEADGISIHATEYTNKTVPPGYEYTDEDKKAMESGELVFSVGSQEVELHEVKAVSWAKDGLLCNLLQIDGELSADELADMAKEIIAK